MPTKPDYAIVLDFEATCDDQGELRPQEIIEFPSIAVSLNTLENIDEFREFVKPHHNPVLTEFCKKFTSICQHDVDAGRPFGDVFNNHQDWLRQQGFTADNSVIVTCGDWDLYTMLPSQCASAVPGVELIPPLYLRWHNIKRSFCAIRKKQKAPGMAGMMRAMDLPIIGHHHSGIDDCRNISELLKELIRKGTRIEYTTELPIKKYPPISLQLRLGNQVEQIKLTTRSMRSLIGIASQTYKRRISEFYSQKGNRIKNDNDLRFLIPGEEIILNG